MDTYLFSESPLLTFVNVVSNTNYIKKSPIFEND